MCPMSPTLDCTWRVVTRSTVIHQHFCAGSEIQREEFSCVQEFIFNASCGDKSYEGVLGRGSTLRRK